MRITKSDLLLILAAILPSLLIFKAFFMPGPLVWGDAPYFYPENLKELFQKPLAWDLRLDNFGAPQLQVLWLYLPTFLFGLLHQLLGLNSEALIRVIFYFPAVILAYSGAWLLCKEYVKNSLASLLGASLYVFNTYFLLLIDGGQIGVALSFGIFPWTIFFWERFIKQLNLNNFFPATFVFFVLTNVDLRVAMLAVWTLLVLHFWQSLLQKKWWAFVKYIKSVVMVAVAVAALDALWLVPLLLSPKLSFFSQEIVNPYAVNFVSFINGLTLFNPHFPQNEFGGLNSIPIYFYLLPVLIFAPFLFKSNRKFLYLAFANLTFMLLVSGFYNFFLQNVPFASAFRDSTKFFIPAILFSSILLSLTANTWNRFLILGFILFLIWPSLKGELTGVLAGKSFDQDYRAIYQNLRKEEGFFRSVWFPERPPLGFSMQGKEGVSASDLYKEIPFALMIGGTYDLFNFLHDEMLGQWFEVLGIKYVFSPPPERKKTWSEKELADRKLFLQFIGSLPYFEKLNWPSHFPAYKVANPSKKIFGQDKLILVVGDGGIYRFLNEQVDNFSLVKQGFIFAEDGLWDVERTLNLPPKAIVLVFHQRQKLDLTLSLLQNLFLQEKDIQTIQWGKYQPNQYLSLKYELLKNGIDSLDLTFSKGMIFSSIKAEKISYKVSTLQDGEYFLALRTVASSSSAGIKLEFQNQEKVINRRGNQFNWDLIGPVRVSQGQHQLTLTNLGGFQAVNAVAVLSQEQFNWAEATSDKLLNKFDTINLNEADGINKLKARLSLLQVHEVDYGEKNPTEYSISFKDKKPSWLIFSDHYHPGWQVKGEKNTPSFPVYSMINAFWVKDLSRDEIKLYFTPQDQLDAGLKISITALVLFIGGALFKYLKKMISLK